MRWFNANFQSKWKAVFFRIFLLHKKGQKIRNFCILGQISIVDIEVSFAI